VKDDGTGRIESVMSGADVDLNPAATAGDENLSAKEKKKREKEATAREKKEKEEMKRRLKQQDREIKEEAKKKTETPADKRRRRRREAERNTSTSKKGPLNFLSPKRPGVQPKNVRTCRVNLLDGTDYQFEIEVC